MFSVDSWELNNFVWAYDNPGSRLRQQQPGRISVGRQRRRSAVADPAASRRYVAGHIYPPALAHRDRKINLNFPLPVSNDPNEPVRQKWIRETYQMLKAVLPPMAVDTPEELAQLSQFVVNIVDFRDPDGTMTRFVNTDLVVTPATSTAAPVLHGDRRPGAADRDGTDVVNAADLLTAMTDPRT